MTDRQRLTKQIIIALVFFLIIGGISFGVFRVVRPPLPSPTPNPTAHLNPIKVIATSLIHIQNNDYDFVAKVSNPNTDYGSADVAYQITFYNSTQTVISTQVGSFYILPGQTKHVIASPLQFTEPITRAELAIKSVDWQQLDPLGASGVSLIAKDYSYSLIKQSGVFSKVGGAVLNNSNYDLSQVDLVVLALDTSGEIIAVNRTQINTFLAKTTRGFAVSWFSPFVGTVAGVEVEANSNLFLNSTFLRQYQQSERFQQFY